MLSLRGIFGVCFVMTVKHGFFSTLISRKLKVAVCLFVVLHLIELE